MRASKVPPAEADLGLTEQVRILVLAKGASEVGFADLTGLAEWPRAVAAMIAHSPEVLGGPETMPGPDYYREYLRLNRKLDELAAAAAACLREAGYAAHVNPATQTKLDLKSLTSAFPHKTAATRAGLGWIGKSALLVNPRLGPAVRLTTILTDAPLAAGTPITESRCGDCAVCVEACPGGAISGVEWRAGMERGEFFNAFACHRVASARARTRGMEHTVCGVCMAVCPKRPQAGK